MANIKKCFEVLGLRPGATEEEIKETVRDLVKVWHPDRFNDNARLQQKAQEKLKEINEAYDTLKEYMPLLRAKTGAAGASSGTPQSDTGQPSDLIDKLRQKKASGLSEKDVDSVAKALSMMMGKKK